MFSLGVLLVVIVCAMRKKEISLGAMDAIGILNVQK